MAIAASCEQKRRQAASLRATKAELTAKKLRSSGSQYESVAASQLRLGDVVLVEAGLDRILLAARALDARLELGIHVVDAFEERAHRAGMPLDDTFGAGAGLVVDPAVRLRTARAQRIVDALG